MSLIRQFDEARHQVEIEKEREGRERRVRMRRVQSMVEVDYKPRREMFRLRNRVLTWVTSIHK